MRVRQATGTLLGAAAGIAVVTVLARVFGLGRTAVFSHAVGYECVASTYQVANNVPNVVFEVVAGGALASLVVPILAPAVEAGDRAAASRIFSALLSWTLVLLVPVMLVGLLVAPTVIRLLLGEDPTCGPQALVVGTDLLRVFLPQVVLYGLAVVLIGVLQAHRRFLGPALAPLLSSLVVGSAYLLYAQRGAAQGVGAEQLLDLSGSQERVLGVGTTLGVVALTLAVVVPLRGTGLAFRPSLSFPGGLGHRARRLALAGLAGLLAQQIAFVVGLRLASGGGSSDPAVFTVAWTMFLVPWAVLAVPVATSAFPRLVAAVSVADFGALTGRAFRLVVVLSLAGAAAFFAAAGSIAVVLAQGPELAGALRAFAPGLVGYGVLAVLSRALYARAGGRAAASATVAGWAVVVAADLVLVLCTDLSRPTALGFGNTLGMTLSAVLLARALHRTAPSALTPSTRTVVVGTGAAVGVGLLLWTVPTPSGVLVNLVLGAVLAVVAAGAVIAAIRLADQPGYRELRRG